MSREVHISERAAGLTAYYFAGKLAEIRRRMAEGQDIINLGVGSPDLAPAEGVVDAVRRGAGEEGAFRYQPYRGIPALTAAMACTWQCARAGATQWQIGAQGAQDVVQDWRP